MKIIIVNQKTFLARHWLKWYKVARSAEDWRKLEIKSYKKKPSIKQLANILNEQKADKIVNKNIKSHNKKLNKNSIDK